MALTPPHSLRLGVGSWKGAGRRSFRGTWEPTPPDATGLDVGAETTGSHRLAGIRRSGVMSSACREPRYTGVALWVRGPSGPHQARCREAASANCTGLAESLYPLRLPWTSL